MNKKVTKFYEVLSADEALQKELNEVVSETALDDEDTARSAMVEAIASFAAAHDLDLTADDILAADAEAAEGELSDEELAAVAGGGIPYDASCGCFIIGASKGCGCFIGGKGKKFGTDNDFGDKCYALGGWAS